MTAPAAIRGTFSDFKIVRGRKCAQLVIEVPIEQADEALRALGGIPDPSSERWVALARLVGESSNGKTSDCYSANEGSTPSSPAKERRRFSELSPSQQAGLKCNDEAFRRWIAEMHDGSVSDEDSAANWVRVQCEVKSRAELNTNPEATAKWLELRREFDAWRAYADA